MLNSRHYSETGYTALGNTFNPFSLKSLYIAHSMRTFIQNKPINDEKVLTTKKYLYRHLQIKIKTQSRFLFIGKVSTNYCLEIEQNISTWSFV